MQQHTKNPIRFSLKHWFNIGKLVIKKNEEDNTSLVAAGVAFYFLLALFPLLGSLISLYGIFLDPDSLNEHLNYVVGFMPAQSHYIIEDQIKALTNTDNTALGFGFVSGLLLSVWSSGKGADALIVACNITYMQKKARSFFGRIFTRIKITVSLILMIVVVVGLLVILPIAVSIIAGDIELEWLLRLVKWAITITIFVLALCALYRNAPNRRHAQWQWVAPGAVAASVFWIILSFLFNIYISEYASYNKTYGSVGGVIVLLMWFYLTAYIILIGSAINAACELYTKYDTTVGETKPIGERGAVVADTSDF